MKKVNTENYKINNDNIFSELIKNQNKNINPDKKLLYTDLKRISKYLTKPIFNDNCSLWNGYITIVKNDAKKSYINFYFNGKKYALHRLLYLNYIGDLADSEYIKFNCPNKGICCNIKHFYKINKLENKQQISVEPSQPILEILSTKCIETPKNIIVGFN